MPGASCLPEKSSHVQSLILLAEKLAEVKVNFCLVSTANKSKVPYPQVGSDSGFSNKIIIKLDHLPLKVFPFRLLSIRGSSLDYFLLDLVGLGSLLKA